MLLGVNEYVNVCAKGNEDPGSHAHCSQDCLQILQDSEQDEVLTEDEWMDLQNISLTKNAIMQFSVLYIKLHSGNQHLWIIKKARPNVVRHFSGLSSHIRT